MMRLDDREWKPIPIISLFEKFESGKGKGLNHLEQVTHGITYVGATNRNNGVLCFVREDDSSRKMIQDGNCIGFIKNGDGSAGYAIYKREPFISTSDVIFGYADWLNTYTGLFFVAAQDMIEHKYSHGYKRNAQHLKGDRVMLPVNDAGKPDFQFMEDYVRELMSAKREQYRQYVEKRLESLELDSANMGGYSEELKSREWKPILISAIFDLVRGRENNMAMLATGDTPLVSAKNGNNGLKGFVNSPKKVILGHCVTLNNDGDGGAGLAYYQPANMALDTHVTALVPKMEMSQWTMLFISECLSVLHGFFGHGLSISNDRAKNIKIMLPVTEDGQPDYDFMEEFGRKMMSNKYNQYLAFLAMSDTIKA